MPNQEVLSPDNYYHIFNHAIGDEILFKDDKDYCSFINRYSRYIQPVADTIAYCLIPNHFHFCLKIKSVKSILDLSSNNKLQDVEAIIHYAFASLLNGYVQAYNKRYNRMGGLFVGRFKRRVINDDDDLRGLICYIHLNPVEACLVGSPEKWPYSSFSHIISPGSATLIPIWLDELMRIFDDVENLKYVHAHSVSAAT
jgi:putative transposase